MRQNLAHAKIDRTFWPFLLIAVSAISTLGFACVTPFAAFAALAAAVLPMRSALACVLGVWFANQVIGFTALAYPWALDTLLWGLAIGGAAVAATALASVALEKFSRNVVVGAAIGLVVAFVVYEAGLFVVSFALGGGETFTASIIGQFGLLNLVWTIGLLAARELLVHIANLPSLPPVFARR